ncbi:MAG: hypothetical protein ACK5IP_17570 [Paracoccus sp. (in: a-proteobacteria)]
MIPVELSQKLTELESHYDAASTVEKRSIEPRLRKMLDSRESEKRRWRAQPDQASGPVDLFDNMPV